MPCAKPATRAVAEPALELPETALARTQTAAALQPAPELTIVVPTYQEHDNISLLTEQLQATLAGLNWEVLFVDDNSPDGTAAVARAIGRKDHRVRCIRRIGRRGLAGAGLEGMLASQARYVAVMDADLQHDASLLVAMLERLRAGDTDLVVASRYVGGQFSDSHSASRTLVSQTSNALARWLLGIKLDDPMSGFFMIRRDIIDDIAPQLSTQGFKILLDIVATTGSKLRFVELPFVFGKRLHGESKLDTTAALAFIQLVLSKVTNDAISARFVMFCLVGLTGVGIHMSVLSMLHDLAALTFGAMQTIATTAAIAWNFVLNNALTYRDQRLVGWRFATGLIRFGLICAVGALSNVGIATWIYGSGNLWWLAGLGGALMGAVWNYVVSAAFVWQRR